MSGAHGRGGAANKFVQTPETNDALVVYWRIEISLRHPQSTRLMEVLTRWYRNWVTQLAMAGMGHQFALDAAL